MNVKVGNTRAIWEPVPGSPQAHFMSRTESEGLYGGAAGGMKTETLMHWPVKDLLRIPGIQALFLRREYAQLRDVLQRAQQFFIPLGAKFNSTTRTFKFPNGSIYEFNGLQHEQDKYNFQGRAFDRIIFDELTQFTETQYLYLFSRNRGLNNPDLPGRVRAGTNPGGVGHGWTRRRFIEALKPYRTRFFLRINDEDIRVHPETPFAKSRFWIPARVQDNPYYRNTEYVANLMALPEDERRALLEGDWTVFSGQFFKMWRRGIHVLEPFNLPKDWRYFGAYDYGYSSPACYLLMAVDFDGNVYVVREMYQEELSIKDQADRIRQIEDGIKVSARVADTQIFEHRKQDEAGSDDTIALTFQKYGISFVKANKDRMNGWAAMKEYLSWEGNYDGTRASLTRKPALYVTENCHNVIREVEDAVYSSSDAAFIGNKKSRIEDLDTRGSDHGLDPARYGLMYVYKPRKRTDKEPTWQEKFMPKQKKAKGILYFK